MLHSIQIKIYKKNIPYIQKIILFLSITLFYSTSKMYFFPRILALQTLSTMHFTEKDLCFCLKHLNLFRIHNIHHIYLFLLYSISSKLEPSWWQKTIKTPFSSQSELKKRGMSFLNVYTLHTFIYR